jgi:hypothetical protein
MRRRRDQRGRLAVPARAVRLNRADSAAQFKRLRSISLGSARIGEPEADATKRIEPSRCPSGPSRSVLDGADAVSASARGAVGRQRVRRSAHFWHTLAGPGRSAGEELQCRQRFRWGGRWDSNPQQPESQSGTLPLSYGHHYISTGLPDWTRTSDPQLRRLMLYPPELRAVRFLMSGSIGPPGPRWSGRVDSNHRPPAPKAGALPGCATPRSWR